MLSRLHYLRNTSERSLAVPARLFAQCISDALLHQCLLRHVIARFFFEWYLLFGSECKPFLPQTLALYLHNVGNKFNSIHTFSYYGIATVVRSPFSQVRHIFWRDASLTTLPVNATHTFFWDLQYIVPIWGPSRYIYPC